MEIPLSVTLPALALAASDGRFVGLTLEGLLSFEVLTLCQQVGFLPAVVRLLVLLRFPLSIFEKGFPGADFRLSVLGTPLPWAATLITFGLFASVFVSVVVGFMITKVFKPRQEKNDKSNQKW